MGQKNKPKAEEQTGTIKLRFVKDMFYNDKSKPEFEAGKIYDVPKAKGWADRWIKRGAIVVGDEPVAPPEDSGQTQTVPPVDPPAPPVDDAKKTEEDDL